MFFKSIPLSFAYSLICFTTLNIASFLFSQTAGEKVLVIKNKFSEFAPSFKFVKRLDNVEEFVTNNEEKSLKNLIFSNSYAKHSNYSFYKFRESLK